jgi:predicted PurR-regulated permease PerM
MSEEDEAPGLSRAVFFGTLALLGYLAYRIVAPFLSEIAWAVVLAIAIAPLRERLQPRLGRTRAALLLTLLTLVLLVIPFVFAVSILFQQGTQAVSSVEAQLRERGGAAAWLDAGWTWLRVRLTFLPTTDELVARVTAGMGGVASYLAARAGGLLKGIVSFLFSLVITLAVLFFLLRDAEIFSSALRRLLPFGREENERLLRLTTDLVSASITATLAIAGIQGVLGGVAFALLGISAPAVWGVVMAILALLPVVGASIVWAPAAVWLVLSGSVVKGVILLLIGLVLLGNVDNFVRPWLMAGSARLNTLLLLVSLLGGVSAFGFIGIIAGPLVAALVMALAGTYLLQPAPEPPPAPADTGQDASGPA